MYSTKKTAPLWQDSIYESLVSKDIFQCFVKACVFYLKTIKNIFDDYLSKHLNLKCELKTHSDETDFLSNENTTLSPMTSGACE